MQLISWLTDDAGLMHLDQIICFGSVDIMVWLIYDGLILWVKVDGFD